MDAENVLFVEPGATPWAVTIDTSKLSIKELRVHLKARGESNISGSRGELVVALKRLLEKEREEAWLAYQAKRSKTHLRLKSLVQTISSEDNDFELAQVNAWKKEFEQAGAWDWTLDPRSLLQREKQARKQYEIALRARRRQKGPGTSATTLKQKEEGKEEEKLEKGSNQADTNLCKVGADGCIYRSKIEGVDYYCVNSRFKCSDGTELRTCAYHASVCTDITYHLNALQPVVATSAADSKQNPGARGPPRVKMPNEHGLCTNCYRRKIGPQIPPFLKHQCPGTYVLRPDMVAKLAQVNESAFATQSDEGGQGLSRCKWSKTLKDGTKLLCTNIVQKKGKATCGYHCTKCELLHPGISPKIEFPNALGLCRSHYMTKTGRDPAKVAKEMWKTVAGRPRPPGVKVATKRVYKSKEHSLRPRPRALHSIPKQGLKQAQIAFDEIDQDEEGEGKLPSFQWFSFDFAKVKPFLQMTAGQVADKIVSQRLVNSFHKHRRTALRTVLGRMYATVIQRVYRGYVARRRAKVIRERVEGHKRHHAAIVIQTQMRKLLAKIECSRYKVQLQKAVALFQRVVRGYVTRKAMKRKLAARDIQRCVRGYLCRLDVVAHAIVKEYTDRRLDQAWASMVLVRYLKSFIRRWKTTKQEKLDLIAFVEKGISKLQAHVRRRQAKQRFRITRRLTTRACIRIQRQLRSYRVSKRIVDGDVRFAPSAVRIQAVWRGFRARIRALVAREAIEKAWRWVNPSRPRTSFEYLLPKSQYGEPILQNGEINFWMDREKTRIADLLLGMKLGSPWRFVAGDGSQGSLNSNQGSEQVNEAFDELWDKVPFLRFDEVGTGLVRRHEFAAALKEMSYRMTETQINQLVRRWAKSDGTVDYLAFLDYAKSEAAACKTHRLWACPSCVTVGACIKCKCKGYAADSKTHPSKMTICSCGHYVAMHNIVPKANVEQARDARSKVLSRTELNRILTPSVSSETPSSVLGAKLEPTALTMQFQQSDLQVRAHSAIPRSRRNVKTPIKLVSTHEMSKTQATRAFQKLGERIIQNITQESKMIVDEIRETNGWNSSVNPLEGHPGTAPRLHSHTMRGMGEIPKLEGQGPSSSSRSGRRTANGSSRSGLASRGAKARPKTTALSKRAHQRSQSEDNQSSQFAPGDLGKLLLQDAADPLASVHGPRPSTTSVERLDRGARSPWPGSKPPKYVERMKLAQQEKAELVRVLKEESKSASWTNTEVYTKGFKVCDPVPLIVNDCVKMEVDVTPLYVDMLLALASEECGLLEDWSAFVAYVFQSFAFIRRHWRKLVHDIRTGTLDKHLSIESSLRNKVENILKPNPERGAMLDKAFQRLGFYQGSTNGKPVDNNRRDIPSTAQASRPFSAQTQKVQAVGDISTLLTLEKRVQPKLEKSVTSPSLQINFTRPTTPCKPTSVELETDQRKHQEQLDSVDASDVYNLARLPRINPERVLEKTTRKTRRFVCSFAGCGKVFALRATAEEHASKAHRGAIRLANPTPEIDEKFHMYWPDHAPWIPTKGSKVTKDRAVEGIKALNDPEEEQLLGAQAVKIAFPYACKHGDCPARFQTKKEVSVHRESQHIRPARFRERVGSVPSFPWLSFKGNEFLCPPSNLPPGLNLPCCSKHWVMLIPGCPECDELIGNGSPICPLQFHHSIVLHEEAVLSPSSRSAVHVLRRYTYGESRRAEETTSDHLGRLLAVFTDRFGRAYVAYKRFFRSWELDPSSPSYKSLRHKNQVSEGMAKTYVTSAGNIVGTSVVMSCSLADYQFLEQDTGLPKLPEFKKVNHDSSIRSRTGVFFCEDELINPAPSTQGTFVPLVKRLRGVRVE